MESFSLHEQDGEIWITLPKAGGGVTVMNLSEHLRNLFQSAATGSRFATMTRDELNKLTGPRSY